MLWFVIVFLTRLTYLDLSGNAVLGNDVAIATSMCVLFEMFLFVWCDIVGEVCDDFFWGFFRFKYVLFVVNRFERLFAFETNGLFEVVDVSRNVVVLILVLYGVFVCLCLLNFVGNCIEFEGIFVELLKYVKVFVELNLRENSIFVEALRERDGWSEFEGRRKC